jgi:hypothetical protein
MVRIARVTAALVGDSSSWHHIQNGKETHCHDCQHQADEFEAPWGREEGQQGDWQLQMQEAAWDQRMTPPSDGQVMDDVGLGGS